MSAQPGYPPAGQPRPANTPGEAEQPAVVLADDGADRILVMAPRASDEIGFRGKSPLGDFARHSRPFGCGDGTSQKSTIGCCRGRKVPGRCGTAGLADDHCRPM